jgi:uncharacterized protein YbcI
VGLQQAARLVSFSSFRAVAHIEDEEAETMDAGAAQEQPGTAQERSELHLAELSNAMVRLYKEIFGRGPTRARTSYAGPDLIVATLEDTLTRPEARMVEAGDHGRLRELRMYFQYQHREDFVSTVEQLTGRTVRAFVSGIDTEADIASELFYLEPR